MNRYVRPPFRGLRYRLHIATHKHVVAAAGLAVYPETPFMRALVA